MKLGSLEDVFSEAERTYNKGAIEESFKPAMLYTVRAIFLMLVAILAKLEAIRRDK